MTPSLRSGVLLAVLAGTLAILVYRVWPAGGPTATPTVAPTPPQPATGSRDRTGPATLAVKLDALSAEAVALGDAARNPFGFAPHEPIETSGPTPGPTGPPPAVTRPPPPLPVGEPRPPPIPLKFIGIVESPDSALRVAVLSDGDFVYHGGVGEVIDGRYRVMRIGDESIELEYVSGTGRQTIRLSGS